MDKALTDPATPDRALPERVPAADRALVEDLLQRGALKPAQLKSALDLLGGAGGAGGDLKEVLVRLGFVRERMIAQLVAARSRMHFVDPDAHEVDEELLARIPRELVERHQLLPLKREGEEAVLLAISDPDDFSAIDEVQFVAARSVEAALAPKSAIRKALAAFYQRGGKARASASAGQGGAGAAADPTAQARELRQRVRDLDGDTLLKAFVLALADESKLSLARLLERAAEVAGRPSAAAGAGGAGGAEAERHGRA